MKTYDIFGDSLLRGVMPDQDGLYHSSAAIGFEGMAIEFQVVIHNFSMPTFTVVQGEKWMNSTLERQPIPDVAFLEFAGNDCDYRWKELAEGVCEESDKHRTPLPLFEETLKRMIERLIGLSCVPVLVVSPVSYIPRYLEFLGQQGIADTVKHYVHREGQLEDEYSYYVKTMFALAEEYDLEVVDLRRCFEDAKPLGDYYSTDGLHPNERGYKKIAAGFADYFKRHAME